MNCAVSQATNGQVNGNGKQTWKRVMVGILRLGQNLVRALTDPYRPELHYMRGPGPKWRAKHSQPSLTNPRRR
jgi:hypothetical protein